ncbi:HD-GYP domain-containing protein [Gimesia algae]|uniref:Cyclic di-GMP phosphodiesterase response regulator RpfG n=1 Tax=Gimesia algae TaxID=2527971 RepID=A0A517VCX0_9PLAN|nr:HD domain-containing phosphohydrolase [Gimesia algae]QDT90840.1 Cyclic di-GMP phosphodiesterase response regulator RpfG [Gimesia algae]
MVGRIIKQKSSPYTALNIDRLRMGVKLQAPIYDAETEKNILLLASGKSITKTTIQSLKKRGIRNVRVHDRDLSNLTLAPGESQSSGFTSSLQLRSQKLKNRAGDPSSNRQVADTERTNSPWQIQSQSFLHEVTPPTATAYSPTLQKEYRKEFAVLTKLTDDIYRQILASSRISTSQIQSVTNSSFSQMRQDMDLFVLEGITPVALGNICRHGLQMSSLAMAMGTQLGLQREHLSQLCIGCLVHDTGMVKINTDGLVGHLPASPIDSLELRKHPVITYNLLSESNEFSMISRIVAYQVHERCDGSGYPRGQKQNQIHPFAKIAAVADEFISLVSLAAANAEIQPYLAVEQLIYGASRGIFDSGAVRALLQSISLYPVGSVVELNQGQLATVIRTNRLQYDAPVVSILQPCGSAQIFDLQEHADLRVIRSIPHAEIETCSL